MAIYTDYQNSSLNLFVDQGTDFSQIVNLKDDIGAPLDLTGYTCTLEIKKYYSTSMLFAGTAVIVGDPILGTIKIEIPRTTTEIMDSSRYVYRVYINNTIRTTLLDGHILVDRF